MHCTVATQQRMFKIISFNEEKLRQVTFNAKILILSVYSCWSGVQVVQESDVDCKCNFICNQALLGCFLMLEFVKWRCRSLCSQMTSKINSHSHNETNFNSKYLKCSLLGKVLLISYSKFLYTIQHRPQVNEAKGYV